MKGVYQRTRTDCVRACVASLFELELDSVPDFDPEYWYGELQCWLRDANMVLVNVRFSDVPEARDLPAGYSLGAVPCQGADFPDDWRHCVVCLDGGVVWCPILGERDGTQRAEEYTILYRRDPIRT